MTKLVKEQEQILKIVSKYGCISIDQLEQILSTCPKKMTEMMVTQLAKRQYLEIVNGMYIVCYGHKDSFNKNTIDAIWTMLKLTRHPEDLCYVMQASNPVNYIFTAENKEMFEILTLNPTNVHFLSLLESKYQDRQAKSKHPLNSWYVFIVRNQETVKLIKEYDVSFPFIVAQLEDEVHTVRPNIRLLKKA